MCMFFFVYFWINIGYCFFLMYTFFISGNLGFYKEKRHSWNQITFIFNIISNRQYSLCLNHSHFLYFLFLLIIIWGQLASVNSHLRLNSKKVIERVSCQSWAGRLCETSEQNSPAIRLPWRLATRGKVERTSGCWCALPEDASHLSTQQDLMDMCWQLFLTQITFVGGRGVGNGRGARVAVTYFCSPCYHTTEGKKKQKQLWSGLTVRLFSPRWKGRNPAGKVKGVFLIIYSIEMICIAAC